MRIRNVVLVTALMVWPTLASTESAPKAAAPTSFALQRHSVTKHVHVLTQPQEHYWLAAVIGNVTIIEQSDGVVLVDTGSTAADGRKVVAHVRALSSKPVKAVVITHWHDDHPLGLSAILDAWPKARIIGTTGTKEGMLREASARWPLKLEPGRDAQNRKDIQTAVDDFRAKAKDPKLSASERQNYGVEAEAIANSMGETDGTYLIPPTEILNDRILIPDRRAPVEVMFLGRANTEGDAMVWLPMQRVFIAGDAVVHPIPYAFGAVHPSEWLATLKKIDAFPFAILIPGHGKPQTDHAYVKLLIESLEDIQSQVKALDARNVAADKILTNMDYRAQERRFVSDGDEWRLQAFRDSWNPIANCAYREVKGQPIIVGESCRPIKPR